MASLTAPEPHHSPAINGHQFLDGVWARPPACGESSAPRPDAAARVLPARRGYLAEISCASCGLWGAGVLVEARWVLTASTLIQGHRALLVRMASESARRDVAPVPARPVLVSEDASSEVVLLEKKTGTSLTRAPLVIGSTPRVFDAFVHTWDPHPARFPEPLAVHVHAETSCASAEAGTAEALVDYEPGASTAPLSFTVSRAHADALVVGGPVMVEAVTALGEAAVAGIITAITADHCSATVTVAGLAPYWDQVTELLRTDRRRESFSPWAHPLGSRNPVRFQRHEGQWQAGAGELDSVVECPEALTYVTDYLLESCLWGHPDRRWDYGFFSEAVTATRHLLPTLEPARILVHAADALAVLITQGVFVPGEFDGAAEFQPWPGTPHARADQVREAARAFTKSGARWPDPGEVCTLVVDPVGAQRIAPVDVDPPAALGDIVGRRS